MQLSEIQLLNLIASMLDDLDEVRSHLSSVMAVSVDDWFGLPEVDKKLRELAEYKYNQSGCDKST